MYVVKKKLLLHSNIWRLLVSKSPRQCLMRPSDTLVLLTEWRQTGGQSEEAAAQSDRQIYYARRSYFLHSNRTRDKTEDRAIPAHTYGPR